jgi:protein-L-isoaspartate(D-aspartate) O-methyltransferase
MLKYDKRITGGGYGSDKVLARGDIHDASEAGGAQPSMMQTPHRWPPRWPDITDPAVLAALAAVPRHLFVPQAQQEVAYEDIALPIGLGQTISQPYIVALMTQALRLTPESRVLEVGTGSGYQAAILAQITRHVWSIEALPELSQPAMQRLHELGLSVNIKSGDGRLGWPEHAPYDAIIVTAATPEVPPALIAQLITGGRLVIPVGEIAWDQVLWLITKLSGGQLHARPLADVRFVPLVALAPEQRPEDPALDTIRQELRRVLQPYR